MPSGALKLTNVIWNRPNISLALESVNQSLLKTENIVLGEYVDKIYVSRIITKEFISRIVDVPAENVEV